MIVGLLAAGFVAGWLWDQIVLAFFHNPFLNSFILGVLAVGAIYLFWQVIRLNSDISWVENFRTGGHKLSTAQPRLLAPMAAKRLARVLWNDPGTGVMRHADAGYEAAIACAREQGLQLPMLDRPRG